MCFHFIVYCIALALELKYFSPRDLWLLSTEEASCLLAPSPLLYFILNNLIIECQGVFFVFFTKLMPVYLYTDLLLWKIVSNNIFNFVLMILLCNFQLP